MPLTCLSIPLESINCSTEWNLHPWEFDAVPPQLLEDLALNGIIHPPLVLADSNRTFTIVSGAKRLEFIRRGKRPARIDCLVIDKDAPPVRILNLILADQAGTAPLSLAEKARFAAIAARVLQPEDFLAACQKKLQLKNGRSTIPDLLQILQQDEEIISEIHAGRIAERMVFEILALPAAADRLALVRLFKSLGMGDNKQRRFFTLIRDLSGRDGVSVSACLQGKEFTEILDHQEMNIPQKILHLGNMLQYRLNPTVSSAEESFARQVMGLHLPPNYALTHSPSFEKDEVTLSITFKNLAACEQYLNEQRNPPDRA